MSAIAMKFTLAFLCALGAASAADPFAITHQFANRNAHSLIGLPMGSHKTLVEKDGSLRWSQWSLKRKPLDSPFEIGRASCRERVYISVVAVSLKKKNDST